MVYPIKKKKRKKTNNINIIIGRTDDAARPVEPLNVCGHIYAAQETTTTTTAVQFVPKLISPAENLTYIYDFLFFSTHNIIRNAYACAIVNVFVSTRVGPTRPKGLNVYAGCTPTRVPYGPAPHRVIRTAEVAE